MPGEAGQQGWLFLWEKAGPPCPTGSPPWPWHVWCGQGIEVGKLVLLVLLGLHLWAPIPRDPVLPLSRPEVSSTPGHFGFGPALSARLRVHDSLPISAYSDASSPVPGKPGCSSSSSPSTWSSGDLAPLTRPVSCKAQLSSTNPMAEPALPVGFWA